jgi:hypothetical protein
VTSIKEAVVGVMPQVAICQSLDLIDGDVVIHAPGFEDRTLAMVSIAHVSGSVRAILLDYRPIDNRNHFGEVGERFRRLGIGVSAGDVLLYDRFDPSQYEAHLQCALSEGSHSRAVVDISTMSKLAILLTLKVCYELNIPVAIFYAEAKIYGPSREEFETAKSKNEIHRPTLQIYSGIHGVIRVASLASVAMQGQPTAAIVFMSFNDALTQVLLNTVYPSRLFLINGRPPVHSWRETATAWIHDQVRREWQDDNPLITDEGTGNLMSGRSVSTLDYIETLNVLLGLYWRLSADHRILLAPAGSKMQTVGCFLVRSLHPDIHIEYPSPEGFSPEYSSGIGNLWQLDLGNLQDLTATLTVIERQEFLELPS